MSKRRRSARTPQQNYAIKEKSEELISQGMEVDRAIAAAFRMFRDGELDAEINSAPQLTTEQQDLRREIQRRKQIQTKAGPKVIDIAALAGFMTLYKRLKRNR